ncbi:MAG: transporter [Acidobacteriota bacterium]|nr:transporter [Acidobacteriota bacterium]
MAALTTLLPVFFMLALGSAARTFGWVTPEQKSGANTVLFGVLFPLLIFKLMSSAEIGMDVLPIIGYVFVMYVLALLVVGPLTARLTGLEQAHFSKYLLSTNEGGNVALPLYLSIVGASSNTVIFDVAGTVTCFVVIPIMVAREAARDTGTSELFRSIVTNPFIIAMAAGIIVNLTGLQGMIVASPVGEAWTSTLSMATSPIVALILFILGYDLTVDRDTIVPILRLGAVRLAWYTLTILGFFVLFRSRMADREFLMAVLIYFMCPTGFGMAPLLHPLYRDDREAGFTSAFMSMYIVVTLIAYTLVVLLLA